MAVKWLKTSYPNVRYYEHATRRTRNGQADKYFAIRYYTGGKRKEEGLGWASEGWNAEKAHKILASIKENIRLGDGPQSLAEKRELAEAERMAQSEAEAKEQLAHISLADFFERFYIPRVKREKRSWLTDAQRIAKEINPSMGAWPLQAITSEKVQAFVDRLADSGAAPATVKQYMGIIRRAFNIARETSVDGQPLFSGNNPARGLRLPAIHNSRERYLSQEEAEKLIEASAKFPCPDLHDAIVLSLNTGLRLGELMRLRWIDVDLGAAIVSVPDEDKRKPGGKVPLNDAAMAVFRQRLAAQEGAVRVFPPLAGGTTRGGLSIQFRKLVDQLGFNEGIEDKRHRIVFHTLRHTFASWLALAGTDIYRIKTLMRHRNIEMTMRYAHLIPDATRSAVINLKPPTHS